MKLKLTLLILILAAILIAAEWYPISDWTILWQAPDAVNCGTSPIGQPITKITWQREIMEYGPIHGWYPTMQYKYTCNGLKPQEVDQEIYLVTLPTILNIRTITSSTRP